MFRFTLYAIDAQYVWEEHCIPLNKNILVVYFIEVLFCIELLYYIEALFCIKYCFALKYCFTLSTVLHWGTVPCHTTDAVDKELRLARKVKVDDVIQQRNVNSTCRHIRHLARNSVTLCDNR